MGSSITYPQPDHPEFSVIKYAGCHEYRLESRRPHMVSLSLKPLLLVSCMAVSIQIVSMQFDLHHFLADWYVAPTHYLLLVHRHLPCFHDTRYFFKSPIRYYIFL